MWLLLTVSLLGFHDAALALDVSFDQLQIGTRTYTNVTVTTKARNYIFILHSEGMANIKVEELPVEIQQKLGYLGGDSPQRPGDVAARGISSGGKPNTAGASNAFGLGSLVPRITKTVSGFKSMLTETKIRQMKEQLEAELGGHTKNGSKLPRMTPKLAYTILGIGLLCFLFFSVCGKMICVKAGADPGVLIWVPLFQLIPLLRAARMSAWWFLAWLVPLLNIVALITWCIKIAQAREKSVWVGILLLVPGISLFAFLYLAFSSGSAKQEENLKQKPSGSKLMVLHSV